MRIDQLVATRTSVSGLATSEVMISVFAPLRSLDEAVRDADALIVGDVTDQYLEWDNGSDPRREVLVSEIETEDGVVRVVQWAGLSCIDDKLVLGYAPHMPHLGPGQRYAILAEPHPSVDDAWQELYYHAYAIVNGGTLVPTRDHREGDRHDSRLLAPTPYHREGEQPDGPLLVPTADGSQPDGPLMTVTDLTRKFERR